MAAKAVDKMSFEGREVGRPPAPSGEAPLEESIAIYERGAALKAHCESKLKTAELKVEQIVQGVSGKPETEPAEFD